MEEKADGVMVSVDWWLQQGRKRGRDGLMTGELTQHGISYVEAGGRRVDGWMDGKHSRAVKAMCRDSTGRVRVR